MTLNLWGLSIDFLIEHCQFIVSVSPGMTTRMKVAGAFQNGGGNLEKIDFWRRGFAPPPKINQRKTFVW
jgi:hypothetical protein